VKWAKSHGSVAVPFTPRAGVRLTPAENAGNKKGGHSRRTGHLSGCEAGPSA
jgi:hypothetical protein